MKTTAMMWATRAVGAGAVALLLATPAFAQSRSDWNRNNNNSNRGAQATQTRAGNDHQYQRPNQTRNQTQNQTAFRPQQQFNNSDRAPQRAAESGRITSFARERDGYRVGLDRGGSYWVPEARARGLSVGLSVNLGGISPYASGYVRGVIDDVDYRTGTVLLHDAQSGAEIRADVGNGYALGDLHRGELVELTGQWIGGGIFDVAQVMSIQ